MQIFKYKPKQAGKVKKMNVTVALIASGADGCSRAQPITPESCFKLTMDYLQTAGKMGIDLAVLPENWPQQHVNLTSMTPPAQSITGALVTAVREVASRYGMNVVAPIHELRGGLKYNTAVVINRTGDVVGTYSKVFPVWGNKERTAGEVFVSTPSQQGVKAFDLDIGRMSVLICFDINFMELWHQAEALGSDFIVWPSAMATPDPSSYGYARLLQLPIIAVGSPGDVVDMTGEQLPTSPVAGFPFMKIAKLNLNRAFVHWDYNRDKVKQLLSDYPDTIDLEIPGPPFYLLRSNSSSVVLRDILVAREIETNREYIYRSRQGLNALRQVPRVET